jgi:hypothetical protein
MTSERWFMIIIIAPSPPHEKHQAFKTVLFDLPNPVYKSDGIRNYSCVLNNCIRPPPAVGPVRSHSHVPGFFSTFPPVDFRTPKSFRPTTLNLLFYDWKNFRSPDSFLTRMQACFKTVLWTPVRTVSSQAKKKNVPNDITPTGLRCKTRRNTSDYQCLLKVHKSAVQFDWMDLKNLVYIIYASLLQRFWFIVFIDFCLYNIS